MTDKMSKKQEEEAKKQFEETIKEINHEDVISASEEGFKKIKTLNHKPPKILKQIWEDIKMMVYLIKDYVNGDYRDISWKTIAAITGAIIYFVSPIDLIPDFIPVIGYLDDLTVLKMALKIVTKEFDTYKEWKLGEL